MTDSDEDIFIGESDGDQHVDGGNPLALSSRSGTPSSSCSDTDDPDAPRRPLTRADAERLHADVDTLLEAFTVAVERVKGHEYLTCATPTQAGSYSVAGIARLRGRIVAEKRHVQQSLENEAYGQLRGNNVASLAVTVALLATAEDVSASMCRVGIKEGGRNKQVELDLIADGGQRWIKVKASSTANFMREIGIGEEHESSSGSDGGGEEGSGTLGAPPRAETAPFLETLRVLVRASEEPQFRLPFGGRPRVVVACAQEPPAAVRRVLQTVSPSIEVWTVKPAKHGMSLPDVLRKRGGDISSRLRPLPRYMGYPVKRINLDVTAMVAIICDCCHGHAGVAFPEHPILQQQSRDEADGLRAVAHFIEPVLRRHTVWGPEPPAGAVEPPSADASAEVLCALDDPCATTAAARVAERPWETRWPQNWIASEVALAELKWIVDTIAGEDELRRFHWLMRRVESWPKEHVSEAVATLKATKRIQPRHRAVFGLGDKAGALTLSGNRTVVQAAQEQGLSLLVAFHPSRALTERKRRGLEVEPKTLPPAVTGAAARNSSAAAADDSDA